MLCMDYPTVSFPGQVTFISGADNHFWYYIRLTEDNDIAHQDSMKLTLDGLRACGCALEPLLVLQTNLFNGWMDKFRMAGAQQTDAALSSIPTALDFFQHESRTVAWFPTQKIDLTSFKTKNILKHALWCMVCSAWAGA